MDLMKQRKILIPLLAAGMVLLLVCGVLGGYAMGLAKGRTAAADALAAQDSETVDIPVVALSEDDAEMAALYADSFVGFRAWPDLNTPTSQEVMNYGFNAYRIPDETLAELSTARLLQICLCHPAASNLISSQFPAPFPPNLAENLSLYFNGMQELMRRDDLSSAVAGLFLGLDRASVENAPNLLACLYEFSDFFFANGLLAPEDCGRIAGVLPAMSEILGGFADRYDDIRREGKPFMLAEVMADSLLGQNAVLQERLKLFRTDGAIAN